MTIVFEEKKKKNPEEVNIPFFTEVPYCELWKYPKTTLNLVRLCQQTQCKLTLENKITSEVTVLTDIEIPLGHVTFN